MKTSVLMSVYNGQRFLNAQLNSIRDQSVTPDEVIIIDDMSNDDSVSIIEQYIIDNHLESKWRLVKNRENRGWKVNFMEGILSTTGDIVFFADQDDVWLKNKVEIYKQTFENSELNVLISPYIEWRGESISIPEMKPDFHVVFMKGKFKNFNITGSGCTLAFRKQYYLDINKYYVQGWAHDDFFRKMPQVSNGIGVFESPSILRRFHGENASKKKRTYKSTLEDMEVGIQSVDMIALYIKELKNAKAEKENEKLLKRLRRGYCNRRDYFATGKLSFLLKTVLLNHEQYLRLRQIPGDFLLVSKERKKK